MAVVVDYVKLYSDDLAPQFSPGERLVAMQSAGYIPGNEDLGLADQHLTLGERAAAHLMGLPVYRELTTKIVSGTSLAGFPGCLALGLRDALRSQTAMLGLTTQRMLVAETPFELKVPPAVTWVAARTAVAEIRRLPRIGQAGRLMVTLADGSAVAVMMGALFTGPSKRFAAAWAATAG